MNIWKLAKGKRFFKRYENEIYRIVEGQYFITTRKLVDSDEEHDILERELDKSKPPILTQNARGRLHFLLYTPFRYPPLKSGARFHTRSEQSIFYGAEDLQTAMAEVAFGRFTFIQHSEAVLEPMTIPYTHFVAKVKSGKAILLTQEPFKKYRNKISDPTSYAFSQPIGTAMRKEGAEMFTYFSARSEDGVNVGLFSMEAFAQNTPLAGKDRHWDLFVTNDVIEFQRSHMTRIGKESHVFRIQDFCVKKAFPRIAS